MKCHIVPMAYLKEWSTNETRNEKNRKDRQIHCFNKDDLIESTCYTDEISNSHISEEDLYILEVDEKKIEDFFSVRYENKIEYHRNRIENEINAGNIKINNLDLLIEFMAVQIYRTPSYAYNAINQSVQLIYNMPIIKSICNDWKEENTQHKFLDILLQFIDEKPYNPISRTLNSFVVQYRKILLVTKNEYMSFITSDKPVIGIINNGISGIYFPLSRKVCIWLKPNDERNKNNGDVYIVGDEMVSFINELIRQGAMKNILSDKADIRSMMSNICPVMDYMKIGTK